MLTNRNKAPFILQGIGHGDLVEDYEGGWHIFCLGFRQKDFLFDLTVDVTTDCGEAGVTVYMCEEEHYEVALRDNGNGIEAVLRLNIGGIKHVQTVLPVSGNRGRLRIVADNLHYHFYFGEEALGSGQTKYLTSEVSGGFTGVIAALYAVGENTAVFENFSLEYKSEA